MIDSIKTPNQLSHKPTPKRAGLNMFVIALALILGAGGGFYAGAMLMKKRANDELSKFKQEVSNELEQLKKEQNTATATLYFYDQGGALIPVVRNVTLEESAEKTVLLMLISGINEEEAQAGLTTFIPGDASLVDIVSANGIATVTMKNLGSGDSLTKAREQISSTLKTLGVKEVRYSE